jgi:hypothetical protein
MKKNKPTSLLHSGTCLIVQPDFHTISCPVAKPYQCPVSHKGFCRNFDLKKHARKLHAGGALTAAPAAEADQLSDSDSPLPSPVCYWKETFSLVERLGLGQSSPQSRISEGIGFCVSPYFTVPCLDRWVRTVL